MTQDSLSDYVQISADGFDKALKATGRRLEKMENALQHAEEIGRGVVSLGLSESRFYAVVGQDEEGKFLELPSFPGKLFREFNRLTRRKNHEDLERHVGEVTGLAIPFSPVRVKIIADGEDTPVKRLAEKDLEPGKKHTLVVKYDRIGESILRDRLTRAEPAFANLL